MFVDEDEIRRALRERSPSSGRDAWRAIAPRLLARRSGHPRRLLAAAALAGAAAAAAIFLLLRPPTRAAAAPAFEVRGMERDGRPVTPILIAPDRKTLIVIAPPANL